MDHNLEDSLNLDSAMGMDFEHVGDVVVSQADISLDAGSHDAGMNMEFEHIEEQPILMDTGNEEIIDFMGDQFTIQEYSVQDDQTTSATTTEESNQNILSSQSNPLLDMQFGTQTVIPIKREGQGQPKFISLKQAGVTRAAAASALPRAVAIAPKPAPRSVPIAPRPVALVSKSIVKVPVAGVINAGSKSNTVLAQVGKQLVMMPHNAPKLKLVTSGSSGVANIQYIKANTSQAQLINTKNVASIQSAKPIMAKVIVQGAGQSNLEQSNQQTIISKLLPASSAAAPQTRYVMQQKTVPISLGNKVLLASPTKQGMKFTKKQQVISIKSPTPKLMPAPPPGTTKQVVITANPPQNVILKTTAPPKTAQISKEGKIVMQMQRSEIHQIHVPGKGIQYIKLMTNQTPSTTKTASRASVQSLPGQPKSFVLTDSKGNLIQVSSESSASGQQPKVVTGNSAPKWQQKFVRIASAPPVTKTTTVTTASMRSSQSLLAPLSPLAHPVKLEDASNASSAADERVAQMESEFESEQVVSSSDSKASLQALIAEAVQPDLSMQEVEIDYSEMPQGKPTTNLKNHLATKHTNEYQVVEDLNKKMTCQLKSKSTIENLKKLCVRLVTTHGRPLAMMEDEAFQEIINIAAASDVASKTINVETIKSRIHEEANSIRRKISDEVKNRMISLKLDSATCLKRKFIGVNIQYVLNGRIVVRNLAVLEVCDKHTSSFLKTTIEELLTNFMIDSDQIYCICTDNGRNIVKMVELRGGSYISEDDGCTTEQGDIDKYEDSEDENSEGEHVDVMFSAIDMDIENVINNDRTFKIRGMLCAAHTLQLAIKDAINSDIKVQTAINMARNIVTILRKPNNLNSLRQANLRKPIKDCATRWTSTYNMLVRLKSLQTFCNDIGEISEIVSDQFWVEIDAIVNCLKPANEATIKLQKEQLTMGDFYITWLNCKSNMTIIDHKFAVTLHAAMNQRELNLMNNDVVLGALYVDGRINVLLSEDQCLKARTLLKQVYLQNKFLKERNSSLQFEHSDSDPELVEEYTIENATPSTSTNYSAIESLLQIREIERGSRMQNRSFDVCLRELCVKPRVNLQENIILHWQNMTTSLSEVADVANVVLGAPATQVSVKRLFSSLKFLLHPLRSNISPTFLKDIMLVRENQDLL